MKILFTFVLWVGLVVGGVVLFTWAQTVIEAPVSIQPKAGESPTAQIDLMPGGACKTLAAQPAETLGMYRLCAQNRVLWVDFGLGYQRGIPALPMSKVLIQCTSATVGKKGSLSSGCSLVQQ